MTKSLAIFLLAVVCVLLLAGGYAAYSHFSNELTQSRMRADEADVRTSRLESEISIAREKLRAAEGRADEATALRNLNTDLQNQLMETKLKRATPPADGWGGGFNPNRDLARLYAEMIARNDAKMAELANDAAATARLRRLDEMTEDQRKAELVKLQQAGDAITIDNETIPLGTPGLDDKLRRLMLEQGGGRRRGYRGDFGGGGFGGGGFGGGRRYEPEKQPETNGDKF